MIMMGKGDWPPWKCCKVLFVLQRCLNAQTKYLCIIYALFVHYFEKMSSASRGLALRSRSELLPLDPAGQSCHSEFRPPYCPLLEKNPAGADACAAEFKCVAILLKCFVILLKTYTTYTFYLIYHTDCTDSVTILRIYLAHRFLMCTLSLYI